MAHDHLRGPRVERRVIRPVDLAGNEKQFADTVHRAVARLQASAEGRGFLERVGMGDIDGVIGQLDWAGWSDLLASTRDLYAREMQDGAVASLVTVGGVAVALDHHFGAAADEAARSNTVDWLAGVTDTGKDAIREVMSGALRDGLSVPTTARMIHDVAGLNAPQAAAVARYRASVAASGATDGMVRARVGEYVTRLQAERAVTISRYELMQASNRGILAGYERAVAGGAIAPDAQVTVIVGSGCCSYCAQMQPTTIGGQFFYQGQAMDVPPFHPRCRCTIGIR